MLHWKLEAPLSLVVPLSMQLEIQGAIEAKVKKVKVFGFIHGEQHPY